MAKPDPASMHRDVVAKAKAAGTRESAEAHDAGTAERLRKAHAENDKAGTN